ncbi:hypothetical protein [Emticicia agri]|uniref:Copper resistance protein NlpE n=1 Tax=Emticicia agri TaxID=2492393 RepID=A0A4Q5LST8_9BACT|nr:hypothetical protein [Emticicia agri]RYU92666.1 hypothetical protein EWM59_26035 [Emticicia agri]
MKKIAVYCSFIFALGACNSKNAETQTTDNTTSNADTVATATGPVAETLCFEEKVGKDLTTVSLTIEGNKVTGKMEWLPWEKDQARGTLMGEKKGNEIIADYEYMIEGSNQLEEKIFVLEGDKLLVKSGELEDKNGKLILKDRNKATIGQTLVKVACP